MVVAQLFIREIVANEPSILYVGVGGGMELLQFSYFNRNRGAIIGVDSVTEMFESCDKNLIEAELKNDCFKGGS